MVPHTRRGGGVASYSKHLGFVCYGVAPLPGPFFSTRSAMIYTVKIYQNSYHRALHNHAYLGYQNYVSASQMHNRKKFGRCPDVVRSNSPHFQRRISGIDWHLGRGLRLDVG